MTITITPELQSVIEEQIKTGRFASAEEVVAEGLRLFKQHLDFQRFQHEALRRELEQGHEQAQRGDTVPFDADAMQRRIRERLAAERAAAESVG